VNRSRSAKHSFWVRPLAGLPRFASVRAGKILIAGFDCGWVLLVKAGGIRIKTPNQQQPLTGAQAATLFFLAVARGNRHHQASIDAGGYYELEKHRAALADGPSCPDGST
jgi:hypothetical protein